MDALDFVFSAIAIVLALTVGVAILPIAGVVLLVRWLMRRARGDKALKAAEQPYAYLDDSVSQDAVTKVMRDYEEDAVLGPYARDVLSSFAQADLRRKGIFAVMEQEFDKSSLTWDKYAAPVEAALDGVMHNAAQLANRMQAFDSKEYQRMGRINAAGGYSEDSVEVKRLQVMASTLDEMDGIQAANDRLLVELENLQAELTSMSGSGYGTKTDEIVEEIKRLADDAKYYA